MNATRTFNGVLYTFQSTRDAQKAVDIFVEIDDPIDMNEFDERINHANIEFIIGNIA